jgi:DNA repair protein RadD
MTAFRLRPYQQQAKDALWNALRMGEPTPLAVLPTGAGKSPVVASMCLEAVTKWQGRVLVLVHVKELVAQLAETIRRSWPDAFCPLGVLSAGLGSTSVDRITVAGIQTAFRRSTQIGPRDLVIIDEAHLIPPDGDGMYRTLLNELRIINPKLRVVGVTATPYRLGFGRIDGGEAIFSNIVHSTTVRSLMDWPAEEGGPFLSRIVGKDGGIPDLSAIHHRGGEFVATELEAAMSDEAKVSLAVREVLKYGGGRSALLVFCCGVSHALLVSQALAAAGVENAVVTGETPTAERDEIIARYKAKALRCLVNVNVLTTGFDAPHVDMVVLLRPTESPGLYYQMVGRGFRMAPGKTDCLVLDLAGNISRHGPIDTLNERILAPGGGGDAPMKTCPQCASMVLAGSSTCQDCQYEFKKPCPWCGESNAWDAQTCSACGKPMKKQARHETEAADGDPINGQDVEPVWYEVNEVQYYVHEKRGAPPEHPKTLRVDYLQGMSRVASEWVCVEHDSGSFAGQKAMAWLGQRFIDPVMLRYKDGKMFIDSPDGLFPLNALNAMACGRRGELRQPRRIAVKPDGKYQRITSYELMTDAEMAAETEQTTEPAMATGGPTWMSTATDDEVPF